MLSSFSIMTFNDVRLLFGLLSEESATSVETAGSSLPLRSRRAAPVLGYFRSSQVDIFLVEAGIHRSLLSFSSNPAALTTGHGTRNQRERFREIASFPLDCILLPEPTFFDLQVPLGTNGPTHASILYASPQCESGLRLRSCVIEPRRDAS